MKRYLVKHISKATPNNPNFAGLTSIAYFGKEEKLLKHEGSAAEKAYSVCDSVKWMLEDYGYKRECDARKSYIYRNPENTEFWNSTVEIVEINI